MKNVFSKETSEELVARINRLSPQSKALWGKMNVAQMLAHCNVTYEYVYEDKHKKPGVFKKLILKSFLKPIVVSEKPYKKDSPTGPDFLIKTDKNFEVEKERLIKFVRRAQEEGEKIFNGRESHSFGKLNSAEWNNMFFKHLDHHLNQFGV